MACTAQLGARAFSPPVLPHDGVVNRLAGPAVPEHCGFTLVGDAHRANVAGFQACRVQRFTSRGKLGAPDLHRIVFYPTGSGVNLRQLQLRLRHDVAALVKHNTSRAGGSLVKSK